MRFIRNDRLIMRFKVVGPWGRALVSPSKEDKNKNVQKFQFFLNCLLNYTIKKMFHDILCKKPYFVIFIAWTIKRHWSWTKGSRQNNIFWNMVLPADAEDHEDHVEQGRICKVFLNGYDLLAQ